MYVYMHMHTNIYNQGWTYEYEKKINLKYSFRDMNDGVCGEGGGMEEGRVENTVYRGNKASLDLPLIHVNVV